MEMYLYTTLGIVLGIFFSWLFGGVVSYFIGRNIIGGDLAFFMGGNFGIISGVPTIVIGAIVLLLIL